MVTPDLLNYVRAARKRGMSDAEITQNLLQVGWDEASAQEGLYSDKPQQQMQQQMPSEVSPQPVPHVNGASMYSDASMAAAVAGVPIGQEPQAAPDVATSGAVAPPFWTRGIFWGSIVGALLLIGVAGGAFAYYELPNIFSTPPLQPAGISKKAATTTPLFPVVASTAPTTSKTPASTSAGPTSCVANDINCLIAAARTCAPTKTELNAPAITMFGLIYGGKGLVTLAPTKTPTLCTYSERAESIHINFSPEELQKMKAEGITAAQAKSRLAVINAKAQKGVGMTITCTMSTAQIVSILTKTKNGEFNSSEFPPGKCVTSQPSGSANGKGAVSYPSGEASSITTTSATVDLYSYGVVSLIGLEFKVLSLTTSKLSVLITDHNTNKNGSTEDFIVGQTKNVAGRSMILKSISRVKKGTANGIPVYGLQAKLWYHPYVLK